MTRLGMILLLTLLILLPHTAEAKKPKASISLLPVLSAGKHPVDKRLTRGIDRALPKIYKKRPNYKVVEAGPILKRKKIKAVNILQEDQMRDTARILKTDMILGLGVQQKKSNRPKKASFVFYISLYDAKAEMWVVKTKLYRNHTTYLEAQKYLFRELLQRLKGPYPLFVQTDPSGADVVVDGKKVGETPYKVLQNPGKTTITLMKTGRKQMDISFPMPADRPVHAKFPMKEDPNGVAFGVVAPVVAQAPEETPPPVEEPPQEQAQPEPQPEPEAVAAKQEPEPEPEPEAPKEEPAPEPEIAQAEPEPEPEPEIVQPAVPLSERRKWAWRSIGLGVGMALGGVAATLSNMYYDDQAQKKGLLPSRKDDYAASRDQAAITSYALYGLAAAGITTGLILYFTEPASSGVSVNEELGSRAWSMQAGVLPGGGAVKAQLDF